MFFKYPTTIVIASAALIAFACPSIAGWCEVDFRLIGAGQWWRILSGHFTHFDGSHLFWDLLMFVALGVACESRHRRWFAPALLVMASGITCVIALVCDDIHVYRGLSGIDTGLFVWFVIDQCHSHWSRQERTTALMYLAPATALIGKMVYEATTGQTLFVDSSSFTPLVQSHLVGAAIGTIYATTIAVRRDCQATAKRWTRCRNLKAVVTSANHPLPESCIFGRHTRG